MKIYVINGPNLNMLGIREPMIYGNKSYDDLIRMIDEHCATLGIEVVCYQSNHEGELVDKIQEAYFKGADGIVINPAAYTHTSIALLDALKSVGLTAVEVHISNPDNREDFRRASYVRLACEKTVSEKGFDGYIEAINYIYDKIH